MDLSGIVLCQSQDPPLRGTHDVAYNTTVGKPALDGTGAVGFVFEELMDITLRKLIQPLASKGISARLLGEQQIRDEFGEQSLNGVDHFFLLDESILFLIQEKWKFVTNQREVSQFLDCCARIMSRMPDYKGRVIRMWVTRTQPTTNGEKSLHEGGAHVVQSSTSMSFLAQMTGQFICEVLGDRSLCLDMIATMPHLLSGDKPLEREIQEKTVAAIHPAKIKVCVVRKG